MVNRSSKMYSSNLSYLDSALLEKLLDDMEELYQPISVDTSRVRITAPQYFPYYTYQHMLSQRREEEYNYRPKFPYFTDKELKYLAIFGFKPTASEKGKDTVILQKEDCEIGIVIYQREDYYYFRIHKIMENKKGDLETLESLKIYYFEDLIKNIESWI